MPAPAWDPRVKEIAEFLWDRFYAERITLDRRGRPNPIVVLHLARRIVKLADRYGVDLTHIDWEDYIDPDLTPSEVLRELEEKFKTIGAVKIPEPESEEQALIEIITMLEEEIDHYKRVLEEEDLSPEDRKEIEALIKEDMKELEEKKRELDEVRGKKRREAREVKPAEVRKPPEETIHRWVEERREEAKPPEVKPPEKPVDAVKVRLPEDIMARINNTLMSIRGVYRVDWYDSRVRVSVHPRAEKDVVEKVKGFGGVVVDVKKVKPTLLVVVVDFSQLSTTLVSFDEAFEMLLKIVEKRGVEVTSEVREIARRLLREVWDDIKVFSRDTLKEELELIADDVVKELRGKTPPTPPPAPPVAAPPAAFIPPYISVPPSTPFTPAPIPPVAFDWSMVSPEDRGVYLTLGVGEFIERCGSTYGLAHGLEPIIMQIVAGVVRDAGRRLLERAATLLEWQAGYWMDRGAEHIAYRGAYSYIIENALVFLQAEEWFKNNMGNSLGKYKFTITDKKPYVYDGARIWVKTVLYKIYDTLGAKPPSDVEAAYRVFIEWKKNGFPLDVTVPLSYTGGLP